MINMKNIFTAICLMTMLTLSAQVTAPFVVDFENHFTGTYTEAMAQQDFPPPVQGDFWYYGMDQGRSEIVAENGNNVLRVKYPAGCVGPNDTPIGCGIQIKWPLPETADTMWVSYRIKFEEGFQFVKGGKLPGLCGGKCYTGGVPATGDGWSARIMWRTGGTVVQYMYFTEQVSQYGDDMKWDASGTQRVFSTDVWHTVLTQIVLNDVYPGSSQGERNGILRSWFDGELALDLDDLRLVDYQDQTIDIFYISTFHGGNTADWSPLVDSYICYDDFWISKNAPDNGGTTHTSYPWENTEGKFIVYPNPVVNELHLQTPKEIKNVEIISLLGNSILQTKESNINVGNLTSGVYFLYVTFEDGTMSKTKFMKP